MKKVRLIDGSRGGWMDQGTDRRVDLLIEMRGAYRKQVACKWESTCDYRVREKLIFPVRIASRIAFQTFFRFASGN